MSVINIYQKRKFNTEKSCTGNFTCKELGMSFAFLEDPVRDEKIPKITAFSEGVYKLGLRKFDEDKPETWSGMTKKYREKYDFFKWHIQILNVPNYEWVYIHVGNKPEDSDGCVLLGMSRSIDWISSSVSAYRSFYEKVFPLLEKGEDVYLHVENCF